MWLTVDIQSKAMNGFTKLFSTLVTSTIWQEDDKSRLVWVTMLAIVDKFGVVQASVPGLANIANVPVDDCRRALEKFKSPDPDSRTRADEGRRIREVEGGWELVNFEKYREKGRSVDRREYMRLKKQESRKRLSRAKPSGVRAVVAEIDRREQEANGEPPDTQGDF
jgi:hypothetical protein